MYTYQYILMKESMRILKALCDPTRFKILKLLKEGDKCVCELVPLVERTQSTVSIQLAKLEHLGVVESTREGKSVRYKLTNKNVKKILRLLERLD